MLVGDQPVRLTGRRGPEYLSLTLQSERDIRAGDPAPGPASMGAMAVNLAERALTSSLAVYYDLRAGCPTGPIVYSDTDTLSISRPVPWETDLPEVMLGDLPNTYFYPGVVGGRIFGMKYEGTMLSLAYSLSLVPLPVNHPPRRMPGCIMWVSRGRRWHSTTPSPATRMTTRSLTNGTSATAPPAWASPPPTPTWYRGATRRPWW